MVHSQKQFATRSGVSSNAAKGTDARWKEMLRGYKVTILRGSDNASYLAEFMWRAAQLSEAAGIAQLYQSAFAFWRFAKDSLLKPRDNLHALISFFGIQCTRSSNDGSFDGNLVWFDTCLPNVCNYPTYVPKEGGGAQDRAVQNS